MTETDNRNKEEMLSYYEDSLKAHKDLIKRLEERISILEENKNWNQKRFDYFTYEIEKLKRP